MRNVNILTNNGVDVKKSLELFGEMVMYDATMNDFLEEVNVLVDRMNRYKNIGDMANYAIEVHALKSDAKYLGFTKLAELAYDHELKSKANDRLYVNNNYTELINETNKMIELSKKYLNSNDKTELNNITSNVTDINQKTILIVDDSNIIQNFIERILHNDYKILVASNGEEAIDIIKKDYNHNIACMLLDLNMPKMDGFAVLDYLKETDLFKVIPVSIITGNDYKEQIERAFTYPIVDMIVKPFNESNIRNVIEKTLSIK